MVRCWNTSLPHTWSWCAVLKRQPGKKQTTSEERGQGHRAGPVLPLGSPFLAHPVRGVELNDLAPRVREKSMNCKQLLSDSISYFISLFHTPPFLPEPRTIAMCRASAFGHHCRALNEKFLAMVREHGS